MPRTNDPIKMLVMPEGGYYVGQCLDHDIVVQGKTLEQLRDALDYMLLSYEAMERADEHDHLADLGPAAPEYWVRFDRAVCTGSMPLNWKLCETGAGTRSAQLAVA